MPDLVTECKRRAEILKGDTSLLVENDVFAEGKSLDEYLRVTQGQHTICRFNAVAPLRYGDVYIHTYFTLLLFTADHNDATSGVHYSVHYPEPTLPTFSLFSAEHMLEYKDTQSMLLKENNLTPVWTTTGAELTAMLDSGKPEHKIRDELSENIGLTIPKPFWDDDLLPALRTITGVHQQWADILSGNLINAFEELPEETRNGHWTESAIKGGYAEMIDEEPTRQLWHLFDSTTRRDESSLIVSMLKCTCPSTGNLSYLMVPNDIRTAADAHAWTWDINGEVVIQWVDEA
jgi:hypothetical protein